MYKSFVTVEPMADVKMVTEVPDVFFDPAAASWHRFRVALSRWLWRTKTPLGRRSVKGMILACELPVPAAVVAAEAARISTAAAARKSVVLAARMSAASGAEAEGWGDEEDNGMDPMFEPAGRKSLKLEAVLLWRDGPA